MQVITSGRVEPAEVDRAERAVREVLESTGEPVESVRLTLSVVNDEALPRPALAQAVIERGGGKVVRAQAAAPTLPEAVDLLHHRLSLRAA